MLPRPVSLQNSPELVLERNFCHQPIPSQQFLGHPLKSQLFHTDHSMYNFYIQAVLCRYHIFCDLTFMFALTGYS